MTLKKILITLFLLFSFVCLNAQDETEEKKFEFGLNYQGELQTDLKDRNHCINLLRLDGKWNITKNFHFNASTLSIAKTTENEMYDFQVFSNIEVFEKIPFTLAMFGFEIEMNSKSGMHTLYAGIRNTGEDYFASDIIAFFNNSSCGMFPTISANYPIATYPYAAMCIHYSYDGKHWGAKASVYNGEGQKDIFGNSSVFNINPQRDKLFCMAQAEYKNNDDHYYLGGSVYDDSPTIWAYAEKKLFGNEKHEVFLLASYGHCFDNDPLCNNYAALGAKWNAGKIETGLATNYVNFLDMYEFSTELSVNIPLNKYVSVKPSIHYIKGSLLENVIGTFRVGIAL